MLLAPPSHAPHLHLAVLSTPKPFPRDCASINLSEECSAPDVSDDHLIVAWIEPLNDHSLWESTAENVLSQ